MKRSIKVILASCLAALALAVGAVAASAGKQPLMGPNSAGKSNSPGPIEAGEVESESAAEVGEHAAEGPDVPIMGPDLDRASRVALEYLGEGTVTETEIEDEESYYEVEITLDNGRQVDVQLDEDFNVVGSD